MRRGARQLAALLVAGAALAAAPRPVRADQSADEVFQEGHRLLKEGKRDEACVKFAESQRISPSPGALLNLGDCHESEGKLATAWAEFLAAARLYTDPGNEPERDLCLREAARLEPRLSRLTLRLKGAVPGLLLKRNGRAVDAAQLDVPLPVDPGVYVITAEARGRVPFYASVLVREQQKSETTVVVPALDPQPAPAPPPAPPTLDYVVGGVGVAALGVGATFGVMALLNNHKAEGKCPEGRCPAESSVFQEADALHDRARTQAWVANASLGLGLVAGGYLLFFAPSGPRLGSTSKERPRVAVSPRPGGLTLSGRFLRERIDPWRVQERAESAVHRVRAPLAF